MPWRIAQARCAGCAVGRSMRTGLYCATNGCTSFLVIDELGGVAHCEICGYSPQAPLTRPHHIRLRDLSDTASGP